MNNSTTEIEASTSFATGLPSDPGQVGVDIFSVQTFKYYALVMSTFVLPIISAFGIVANILNLVVFFSFPNKSSLVYAFMALSVWDLMFLLMSFSQLLSYLLGLFQADFLWMFNTLAIFYYLETVRAWFYDLSVLTTVFISVQRCACVLIPLQYKYYFSDFKMALMSSFFVICFSALHLARCTTASVQVRKNPQTNASVLIFVPANRAIVQMVHVVTGITLPLTSYVVIFGCMWVLILKLRASSALRNRMTSMSTSTTSTPSKDSAQPSVDGPQHLADGVRLSKKAPRRTDTPRQQTSSKWNLRAEQAVTCVCAIFAVCNILEVFKSIMQSIHPTFGDPGYYYYAFLILTSSMIILNAINSTVNIFVYLKFNSQFRHTLRRMLFKRLSKVPNSTLSF